jgi:hypothetical protein
MLCGRNEKEAAHGQAITGGRGRDRSDKDKVRSRRRHDDNLSPGKSAGQIPMTANTT